MTTTVGTRGNDVLQALIGDDTVRALQGDDTVTGAEGELEDLDLVYLNAGNDYGSGFFKNDTVYGGIGDDKILGTKVVSDSGGGEFHGGAGDDYLESWHSAKLIGGRGDDTLVSSYITGRFPSSAQSELIGGRGQDVYTVKVTYSYGHDIIDRHGKSIIDIKVFSWLDYEPGFTGTIITGDRADVIKVAGTRESVIRSGDRGDIVWGGGTVYAGKGHDDASGYVVYGGRGNDTLRGEFVKGGLGHDEISARETGYGGYGNDTIDGSGRYGDAYGEDGDDVITYAKTAYGGAGDDRIEDSVLVYAGVGDDTISGSKTVYAEEGNDRILNGETVHAGDGDDRVLDSGTVYAGDGNDRVSNSGTVYGGEGNDTVSGHMVEGEAGDDILAGTNQEAEDKLRGDESVNDQLFGGEGADELRFSLYLGTDELTGGEGADIFVLVSFEPDTLPDFIDTADIIKDFTFGEDLIDLSAREIVNEFGDLTLQTFGTFTAVKDSEGFVLVIVENSSAANFSADDFILS